MAKKQRKPREKKVPWKNRTLLTSFDPLPNNYTLFNELYSIYITHTLNGNRTAAARQLGIARQTVDRYFTQPPKQGWWIIVLRAVILENIAFMSNHTRKKYRQQADFVRSRLAAVKMPRLQDTTIFYATNTDPDEYGALQHMLNLVIKFKGSVPVHKLTKAAHSGGYSLRTLRAAKDLLGMKPRHTQDDKVYWDVPAEPPADHDFLSVDKEPTDAS